MSAPVEMIREINALFDKLNEKENALHETFEEVKKDIDPEIAEVFLMYEQYTEHLRSLAFELWKIVQVLNK